MLKSVLVWSVCVALLLSGCQSSDVQKLQSENAELRSQISALESELNSSSDEGASFQPSEGRETTVDPKDLMLLYRSVVSAPNSADGVDYSVVLKNTGSETIKYVTISVAAYNSVGDPVACEITNESTKSCRITGPLDPRQSASVTFDCVWYNPTVSYPVIDAITIQYMDDSIVELGKPDVEKIIVQAENQLYRKLYKMFSSISPTETEDPEENLYWNGISVSDLEDHSVRQEESFTVSDSDSAVDVTMRIDDCGDISYAILRTADGQELDLLLECTNLLYCFLFSARAGEGADLEHVSGLPFDMAKEFTETRTTVERENDYFEYVLNCPEDNTLIFGVKEK